MTLGAIVGGLVGLVGTFFAGIFYARWQAAAAAHAEEQARRLKLMQIDQAAEAELGPIRHAEEMARLGPPPTPEEVEAALSKPDDWRKE